MNLIVCSDLHIKNKEPYFSSIKKFLNWLTKEYNNTDILFLGDIFDSSSPTWEIYKTFQEFLLNHEGKKYLLTGNHCKSKLKGNSIDSFSLLNNVFVYDKEESVDIDNFKCLMLPFSHSCKDYEILEGRYDYIFTHITPQKAQFHQEGLSFPSLSGTFVHGHTHVFKEKEYKDSYNNKHIILGVPLSTRHGEDQAHKIMHIVDNQIEYIKVPVYFTYETLDYGMFPENKNNILNIVNAPSRQLVYETYKDYHIRDEGIEVLRTEDNISAEIKNEFENSNILQKFQVWANEKHPSKEIRECVSSKLSTII